MSARYPRQPSRGYSYGRQAQTPSPPQTEDSMAARFSLPSISSLIEAADEGTGRERSHADALAQRAVVDPQLLAQAQGRSPNSASTDSSHPPSSGIPGSDRRNPAPSTNEGEVKPQHQMDFSSGLPDRPLRPMQVAVPPYNASSYPSFGSPGNGSATAYLGSPLECSTGVYSSPQRSLPPSYPPQSSYDESVNQYISHSTPAWQHHHHFPHSTSTPYPPNQDRYICSTCSKAFSRPSSLKIHSYSHTGEKPWRCQIPGCGKTFSVRSNMKRHEKGCHGDGGYQSGGNLVRASPEIAI